MADTNETGADAIISKICMVRFGKVDSASLDALRSEMMGFTSSDEKLAPATIGHWFTGRSAPRKRNAKRFLLGFFEAFIKRDSLDAQQKEIFDKLAREFAAAAGGLERTSFMSFDGNGDIHIRLALDKERLSAVADSISGTYLTYRYRFGDAAETPIAIEVLRIWTDKTSLKFYNWYLHENSVLRRYDGVVIPLREIVWLVGLAGNSEGDGRLRVALFRNTRVGDKVFGSVLWGLLASDVPDPIERDPACVRIVAERYDAVPSEAQFEEFVRSQVRFVRSQEIDHPLQTELLALIDNHSPSRTVELQMQAPLPRELMLRTRQTAANRYAQRVFAARRKKRADP